MKHLDEIKNKTKIKLKHTHIVEDQRRLDVMGVHMTKNWTFHL